MQHPTQSPIQVEQSQSTALGSEVSVLPSRQAPGKGGLAQRKIIIVECARGFAALYVFVSHIVLVTGAADLFHGANYLFHPFGYGHQAVLLFFLLSGFSIHFSSRNRLLCDKTECLNYFYLRFRRIYPLFAFAIGLTIFLLCLSSVLHLALSEPIISQLRPLRLLATFLFLADDTWGGQWFTVLHTNTPLWSLAYEVPYYLAYPLFWRGVKAFGSERTFLATVCISVVFAAFDFAGIHNHLSNVFSLYWLWCAGALLAEWRASGRTIQISANWFYCAVFILFACSQLVEKDAVKIVRDWFWGLFLVAVMLSYQVRFPTARVQNRVTGMLTLAILMLAMILLAQKLPISGSRKLLDGRIVLSAAVMGLFVTGRFSLRGCCMAILRPFYKAGAWSYALYIIQFPF